MTMVVANAFRLGMRVEGRAPGAAAGDMRNVSPFKSARHAWSTADPAHQRRHLRAGNVSYSVPVPRIVVL
jgi:hypothetical protein